MKKFKTKTAISFIMALLLLTVTIAAIITVTKTITTNNLHEEVPVKPVEKQELEQNLVPKENVAY